MKKPVCFADASRCLSAVSVLLASLSLVFTFASCSDDDDDEDSDSKVTVSDDDYAVSGKIGSHYYVDLGLSVKWADRNLGAMSSFAYGDYYAWGETETKDSYDTSNSSTYGVEIDDFAGNADYDAATAAWGSKWRMPTKEEFEELLEKCSWELSTRGNLNGYLVTGSNGNSIFLPAAGYRHGTSLYGADSNGYYWSSTPYARTTFGAYFLSLGSSNHSVDYGDHDTGHTIRPVSE